MNALPKEGPAFDDACKDAMTDDRAVALDIGANVGKVSRQLLELGYAQVHVFEPAPQIMEVCRQNLDQYAARCVFHQVGVTDKPERLTNVKMLNSWVLCGDGQSYPYPVSPGALELQPTVFDCNLVRLDDYCSNLPRIDLMKLDIEGYEYRALRGATQLIARHKPLIICELSKYVGDIEIGAIREFIDFLFGLPYNMYDMEGKHVYRQQLLEVYPYHSSCDVVLYPHSGII